MQRAVSPRAQFLSICALLVLGGCATAPPNAPVSVGEVHVRVGKDPYPAQPLSQDEARSYAEALLPFARLASRSYCRTIGREGEAPTTCEGSHPLDGTDGWKGLFDSEEALTPDDQVTKLSFQVFFRIHADDPKKGDIAFAFRGTRWTYASDWNANFRWITRFFPGRDQYDIVYENASRLVAKAKGDAASHIAAAGLPAVEEFVLYATGHSLGGGLAQLFAYSDEAVKGAIVFDPSPVTGYFTTVDRRRANCNARILRVYERGEVLQYIRAMARRFYPPTTNVAEVDFNVIRTNRFGWFLNHSIADFTDKLSQAVVALDGHSGAGGRVLRRRLMETYLPKTPDIKCMDRKID